MQQQPLSTEAPSPAAVIEAIGLRKQYGDLVAVDGLDVRVPRGSCFGLLGPNGAGKTTFLRMVVGKTPPSGGSLEVLGLPVPAQAGRMRARLGMVPQLDNLDPDFTVAENLRTYAHYFGLAGPVVERRIVELLEFAALGQRADARINALSGGMQRRLSLCRALVNEPDLLILDEPTTGLDPQARQMIWQKLRQLRTHGMTLVLTTHYLEEAERLCDHVAIMDHGRLLDGAAPATLIERHIEPQVVEVYGPGLERFHDRTAARLAERNELVGETRFYYAHDERALVEALGSAPELRFLHRRATLEDVFVKLTGRDLRVMVEPVRVPAWWRWTAVWRRNVLVWRKLAVASVLGNFGEPLLYLLALGFGLGGLVGAVDGLSYLAFLASGIVCSSAMTTASFEATYSAYTRMEPQRTWDAVLTTPLEVRDVVLGEVLWAATKSLFNSSAILIVAMALGATAGPRALLALPIAVLTGFCFASLAMVVTARARSYEFFMYYQTLLITPMLLLSGVFFPLSRMPEALQTAAHLLPLAHAVALVRPLMTGGVSEAPLLHLAVLATWGVGALLLSIRLVERRLSR